MTLVGHAAAAALVQGHPLLRLAWGFVSHAALDYAVDEYRPKAVHLTSPKTWRSHWRWMAGQVLGLVLLVWLTGDYWCILYGALPDIIEAVYITIRKRQGDDVWMSGKLLFPWHRAGRTFLLRLTTKSTVVFGALLIALAAVVVRFG